MKKYDETIKGSFNLLTENEKAAVLHVTKYFHYRTGTKHDDGSLGDVKITCKQLNDCLAYLLLTKKK